MKFTSEPQRVHPARAVAAWTGSSCSQPARRLEPSVRGFRGSHHGADASRPSPQPGCGVAATRVRRPAETGGWCGDRETGDRDRPETAETGLRECVPGHWHEADREDRLGGDAVDAGAEDLQDLMADTDGDHQATAGGELFDE